MTTSLLINLKNSEQRRISEMCPPIVRLLLHVRNNNQRFINAMFQFPVVVYELLLLLSLVVSQMTASLFTNFENSKQRLINAMRPPIMRAYGVAFFYGIAVLYGIENIDQRHINSVVYGPSDLGGSFGRRVPPMFFCFLRP